MLDALGVNEDLDCDKISDNDDINIRNFISAVLYGKHIGLGQLDTQIVQGLFSIANLKIMILCRRDDQGYYSVDRFDSTLKARFTTKEKLDDRNFVEGPAYCGGKLIERQGRYGLFWGCSNYPHCRFTASV